jgi:SecD/SecF fusion protein
MKNKSGIILLAVVISLLCLFYLSFTFVSRKVQSDATKFATEANGTVDFAKRQAYLDSVWTEPVYNLVGIEYTYKDVREKELALGLDLQGGMHVTLEISPIEILKVLAGNSQNPLFLQSLKKAEEMQRQTSKRFVTLFFDAFQEADPEGKQIARVFTNTLTRDRINSKSSVSDIRKVIEEELEDAISRSFNILRNRIDKFGVANPNIQRIPGTGRISIELPGVDNPERVRKLISGVAKLEFWEVWEMQELAPYLQGFVSYLAKVEAQEKPAKVAEKKEEKTAADGLLVGADSTKNAADALLAGIDSTKTDSAATAATDTNEAQTALDSLQVQSNLFNQIFIPTYEGLGVQVKDTARANRLIEQAQKAAIFPSNVRFLWAVKTEKEGGILVLYPIKTGKGGKAPLEGDVIRDARQDFDEKSRPNISMQMNAEGAKKWRKLTANNIRRRIAIVLDDYVYSAPVVQNEIPGGNSSISGNFTLEEANDLANILKAGKMPAPVRIVEEAIVGPSLGRESIQQGVFSLALGLSLVVVFMSLYYQRAGIFAVLALLVNIFFIIGILAQFGAVLTLAGIAGIVLTIGMSVDANVLIYERVREELWGDKPLAMAVKLGYEKAYSSIIDANATTFLTGVILYSFGTGGVKGFAVTLMIGIACSLFSAIFITRLIIEAYMKKATKGNAVARKLSFESPISRNLLRDTNFDFVSKRRIAYVISSVIIVAGLGLIIAQGGLNLGVDFKGGRSYVVRFDEPVLVAEARTALSKSLTGGMEVKTFGANNQLKITTSYLVEDESNEGDKLVETAIFEGLTPFKDKNPEIISSSKVGASIAEDIKDTARLAVIFSLAVLFFYILIRFRKWQYGLGAVVALFHDVFVVFAFFAFARVLGISYEVDQVFIAAMLTVIGYSINDTVVVFDRIREFAGEMSRVEFKQNLNTAINATLSRTLMTSGTTLLVVLILFLFGGEVLRGFSFALLVGVSVGTYSSVFVASPIVLDLSKIGAKNQKTAKNA